MKQENKQFLLRDLCARLPYGVKVDITYSKEHGSSDRLRICSEGCLILNTDILGLYIEDEIYLKPYLRPMSSMTEEEKEELLNRLPKYWNLEIDKLGDLYFDICDASYPDIELLTDIIDWLNKKMFAYRTIDGKDIFELGLALEAPADMYNIKEK